MSHQECHDVGQWVSDNVTQQVEQCVEQDCNWWCACCNKWLCGLIWIVVVVTTWVVTTVCEIVADVITLGVNIVKGLIDIFAGIFTLDWSRIVAGFGEIVGGALAFVFDLIPILIGTSFIGAFVDAIRGWQLRRYVKQLLTDTFGDDPDALQRMLDALGLTGGGGFGLRLEATAARSFVRSDFTVRGAAHPVLADWVANQLDLKKLAGFDPDAWWSRGWPDLVGDDGDISEDDLDHWIATSGVGDDVKQFSLYAMSDGDLQSRLDCADTHSSEVGLEFRWTKRDVMLEHQDQVLVDRGLFAPVIEESPFNRALTTSDAATATAELALPLVIGGFGYQVPQPQPSPPLPDSGMGISAHLSTCTCLEADDSGSTTFTGEGVTGAHFRYRKPDLGFKYTAIHELGHTFGLCHVNGLLRIMFTNADGAHKSVWSWSSAWQYFAHGTEATFTLDEGKKVWQYIVANMDPARLQVRAF
jgi:hypothetical protein